MAPDQAQSSGQRGAIAAVAGLLGVALVAALLGTGQLWLARWLGVFDPAQHFQAGNDRWPFEEFLMAWYAASTVAAAVALTWPLFAARRWWPVRPVGTAAAVVGAGAVLPLARAWSSGAQGLVDPVGGATWAVLLGLLAGAGAALLSGISPAVRRGLLGWVGWTWLTSLAAAAAGEFASPFGMLLNLSVKSAGWVWPAVLGPLVVIAGLAGWAAARGDRWPVLGAVSGPVLQALVAAGLAGYTGGLVGDHYQPILEHQMPLLVSLVAGAVATGVVGWVRARHRRRAWESRQRAGEARQGAGEARQGVGETDGDVAALERTGAGPVLLQAAGLLLVAAGLRNDGIFRLGAAVLIATGVLVVAVGGFTAHRRQLGPLAGLALTFGAWLAGSLLVAWWQGESAPDLLRVMLLEVPVVVALGLVGRIGVRMAAGCGLAVVAARIGLGLHYGSGTTGDRLAEVLPGAVLAVVAAVLLAPALFSQRVRRPAATAPAGPPGDTGLTIVG